MSKGASTRDRLLAATIEMIDHEGEVGVRVDTVAEIAGFTKPVVYHHFGDREGLIVAALTERYFRTLNVGFAETKVAAARCRSVEEFKNLMRAWVDSFATVEGEQRRRLRIEALGAGVARPALQASLAEANRRQAAELAGVLQIAKEEGWFSVDVSPRDLAVWWIGVILSRHLVEIDPDHFQPEQWNSITSWVIETMFVDTACDS